MHALLLAAIVAGQDAGPFNLQGRLVDLAPEEYVAGVPALGSTVTLTLEKDGASGAQEWTLESAQWPGKANLKAQFAYAGGSLKGKFAFTNITQRHLDGVRLDLISATETHTTPQGEANTTLAVKPDTAILFGDLRPGDEVEPIALNAEGLKWTPDTKKIVVSLRLSGYTFMRELFPEHVNSNLVFDSKGRLLVGSTQQPAIYRADLQKGTLEHFASTPDYGARLAVSPLDGTIAYSWANAHEFRFLTPGGQDKGAPIASNDDVASFAGWPSFSGFDAKGRLYVMFNSQISMLDGAGKPAFTVHSALGQEFDSYPRLAVVPDGSFYVGSGPNIFLFDQGGKSAKRVVSGPDWRPGKAAPVCSLAYDPGTKRLWAGSQTDNGLIGRIDSYDANGRYLCTIGRGGPQPVENAGFWPSQCPYPLSIAVGPNGWVYVSNYEQGRAVMEFAPIGG